MQSKKNIVEQTAKNNVEQNTNANQFHPNFNPNDYIQTPEGNDEDDNREFFFDEEASKKINKLNGNALKFCTLSNKIEDPVEIFENEQNYETFYDTNCENMYNVQFDEEVGLYKIQDMRKYKEVLDFGAVFIPQTPGGVGKNYYIMVDKNQILSRQKQKETINISNQSNDKTQSDKQFLNKKRLLEENTKHKQKYDAFNSFVNDYDERLFNKQYFMNLDQNKFLQRYKKVRQYAQFQKKVDKIATNLSTDFGLYNLKDKDNKPVKNLISEYLKKNNISSSF